MAVLSPMLPEPYRIAERRCETAAGDVFSWRLRPEAGRAPAYRPGQFNMLYAFGSGEVPISISGDVDTEHPVHTVRAVGIVTEALQELAVGDAVGLRGPFGSAWPLEAAAGQDLLLIAGGLGLAPLRPVIYHVLRHRERFARVMLLYGSRDPAGMLYRDELRAWEGGGAIAVELTVDRADRDWRGAIGVVPRLIERGDFEPARTLAMVCGPEAMMRFSVLALQRRGVAAERIFLSLERNMRCATGHCGHCQLLPYFICKDGPVFRYDRIAGLLDVREL